MLAVFPRARADLEDVPAEVELELEIARATGRRGGETARAHVEGHLHQCSARGERETVLPRSAS